MDALVSVICVCHNHLPYVEEAIQSVLQQTWKNIELIVVDDGSTDGSQEVIARIAHEQPSIKVVLITQSGGLCRAFNKGRDLANGEYFIDLAADDVLLPQRVARGVEVLRSSGVGVQFSDAELIGPGGERLGFHSDRFPHGSIREGDVFEEVLRRYFICSPTMMWTRNVMEALGGYDDTLSYEDFDFWVRSGRLFQYHYVPESLVKRRIVPGSMGQKQYKWGSQYLASTLRVCEKAAALIRTSSERSALLARIRHEGRQALRAGDIGTAIGYLKLYWRL